MGTRTNAVKYTAIVDDYVSGVERMASKTREAGSEAEKLAQKREAFNLLGGSMLLAGGLMAAGLTLAVTKFADFDQAMSQVNAATHETESNMSALRQAALDAGASTVYSATEAANAVEELGKAGISTKDILSGGLAGALNLAAAGGLGVAEAAETSASALTQFGLKGSDMGHVADLLAAGAGKAQGSVHDLGEALNNVGTVANNTGFSIEETTGFLAAMASYGLTGAEAGTQFKSMLQSLQGPSSVAQKALDELGLSLYDQSGKTKTLTQFIGEYQASLQGKTQAEKDSYNTTIFGSYGIQAATVAYKEGSAGIQGWIDSTNDQGYAAETAAARLDNLKGDVEGLSGAFDTALIQTGSGANDTLRQMVQSATDLINAFNGLDPVFSNIVFGAAAVTSGLLLAGGAALIAVPKVVEFRNALNALGLTKLSGALGKVSGFLLGPWGVALGIGVTALAAFASQQGEAASQAKDMASSLDTVTGAVTGNTRAIIASNLAAKGGWGPFSEQESASEAASKLGISIGTLTSAIEGNKKAIDEVNEKTFDPDNIFGDEGDWQSRANQIGVTTDEYTTSSRLVLGALGSQSTALENAKSLYQDSAAAQDESTSSTEKNRDAVQDAADAYIGQDDAASGLLDTLTQLIDKINEANGIGQDAVRANADYQAALAGISDEVKRQQDEYEKANGSLEGYIFSIQEGTEQGTANAAMFADLADSSQKAAQAQFELDLKTMSAKDASDKYFATLQSGRQTFVDTLTSLTGNSDAAQALADTVYGIPSYKAIEVAANTAQARDDVLTLTDWINSREATIAVSYAVNSGSVGGIPQQTWNADGGFYDYSAKGLREAEAFANGGFAGEGMYNGRAGSLYKFAEPEVGWEAFISGRPGMEARNRDIAWEALQRLGGVPASAGMSSTQVSVAPQVSLAGATLVMDVDGRQITAIIQEQIVAANASEARAYGNGWLPDV
ncbi:phage tail tape measure protein [Herbiconiux solani]|uniref:phage tail tape measure protein n=1 Tax=Herbiconiux solani TaxID=661329 RepID=UPI000824F78F|nr:phage tail tape measure protein [Herbiconiux solani]